MKRIALLVALLLCAFVLPLVFATALLSIEGEQPSPSVKALDEIPSELIPLYRTAAQTCKGLEWTVLAATHKVESGFGRDQVTSSKGAQGPMQFMPATFESYGVDGDGDGIADVNNVADSIFSAANLLCSNGAGDPARLATAVWNYNHSQAYVNRVLTIAATYGVFDATPGAAFAAANDLLENPRVILTPQARTDLATGIVDQRLVALLAWVSQRHTIGVTVFKTGHSIYTRSGSVSNHHLGRGADIFFVDGGSVSSSNLRARRMVLDLASLADPLRPDELGHPFGAIGFPGGFTDADHADHIHIAFDS